MSFAVIQTGGKQYKVKASDILKIEKLKDSKPESKIEFNEVLAYGDDKTLEVGSPLVKGAKVEAELMKNSKNRTIEKIKDSKPESKIEFNEILAYGDDKNLEVGSPLVKGAKVEAELVKNSKNRTILIFKKRRRQNSRRKNGHRQQYSLIKIKKIFAKDGAILSEAKKVEKKETKKIKEEKSKI